VAAAIDHVGNTRRRAITHQMDGSVRFAARRVVELAGQRTHVEVAGPLGEPTYVTFLDKGANGAAKGKTVEVISSWWPGAQVWNGTVGGRPVAVQVRPILNGYDLALKGIHAPARVYTEREADLAALMPAKKVADTSKMLLCPMPGLVVSIAVEPGQEVKAGETLCTVEAMKMQNILKAERDVKVKAIKAKPGESLAVDAVIMEFA
jgi:propionyl-CoA carboxylase alpha chain